MKTRYVVFLLAILFSTASVKADIVYSNGTTVVKVLDLPYSDDFQIQASNGEWYHADLGVMHKQFSLCYVPLFNYGEEKYVLFADKKIGGYDYIYADLSYSELEYLRSQVGNIPLTPELPFWDAWGGKLLMIAVIGVIVFISKVK